MKIHIININETTFARFIWLCFLRRKVYFLAVDAWFPAFRRPFQWVADWALKSGRARDIMELCPSLHHIRERYSEINFYNPYAKIRAWQDKHFGFNYIDSVIPDYAMAYKNVTTKILSSKYLSILALDKALFELKAEKVEVSGLPLSTVGALKAYSKHPVTAHIRKPPVILFPPTNVFLTAAAFVYACGWILSRLRPFGVKIEHVFLAADYINDPRDFALYREVLDGGPLLLVIRSHPQTTEENEVVGSHLSCKISDGRLTVSGALNAFWIIFYDIARLCWLLRWQEPHIFFQIAVLPYRRVVLRALFSRYRPKFFWGRDDYNVEHILRRQELARIGALSHGISHGAGVFSDILPSFQYINFDRYYIFGKVHGEKYKDTWAKDMTVIPSGSFGAPRNNYAAIDKPRPNDIAVFSSIFTNRRELVDVVRNLAEAFPNRKIWLQIKSNYINLTRGKDFLKACTENLSNVIYTTESIFEIFLHARYLVSDPSTLLIEGIQFGVISFMLDIPEIIEVCLLRDYPELCVTSAEQVIERIRSIESGEWRYSRETYSELVDLSGQVFFDVIRTDMDLPARGAPVSLAKTQLRINQPG